MTPADRPKFAAIVMGFAELKGKQLSRAALDLYWSAMKHWDFDDFNIAAQELLRTCEFMPLPKDFEDLRKAELPNAGESWAAILECARRGCEPQLSDAASRALRAIGGIRTVMMSESSKTHFLEKRFAEHFAAMQESDVGREVFPALTDERVRDAVKKLARN